MNQRELKLAFQQFLQEVQPIDPYELRRVLLDALREWEIDQGIPNAKKGES